jgi:hypothetical protein
MYIYILLGPIAWVYIYADIYLCFSTCMYLYLIYGYVFRILYFTASVISFFSSTGQEKSASDMRNDDFSGPSLSHYILVMAVELIM